MMIEDELRDLGYSSFEIACTEGEALEAAARNAPDLVTSDGLLVGESGPAAVRRIRASLEVPLIFITGDPARARDCVPGAPIVEKPFLAQQLVAAVQQARTQFSRGRPCAN
jgi:CheY-like chemotaxis protein